MSRFDRRLLRLLLMALVVLMPLRMAWSAAASYCEHEQSLASSHFGHHAHADPRGSDFQHDDKAKKAGLGDPDCSACHAWVGHLGPRDFTTPSAERNCFTAPPLQIAVPLVLLPDIERPKWMGAA